MNQLSIHYNDSGNKTGFGEFLKRCYDSGNPVGVIYSLNGNIADTIARYTPGTKWVYRRQSSGWERLPEGFFENDPVNSATNWLTSKRENNKSLIDIYKLNQADWVDSLNEPVIELPPNPTPAQVMEMIRKAQWLNTWMITALEIAHSNGLKLALFSFNFGSPPYEVWQYLIPSLILGKTYGAILSLHSYTESGPLLQYNPDGTFTQVTLDTTLRHRKIYNLLPDNAKLPLLYSEFSPSNGYGVGGFSGQKWIDDVGKCADELQKDTYIIGLDGFQLGGQESNLVSILPLYGDYISTHVYDEVDDMPLNIVVIENLIPQDTTPAEFDSVQQITQPLKQDIMWSADTSKYLVQNGLPGSKVIVWNPERWTQGSIIEYLGVPTEVKYFPTSVTLKLKNPLPDVPFLVTDPFNAFRDYANGKHEGIDLDSYTTGPATVHACADGIVESVNKVVKPNSYGIYVVIRHEIQDQIFKTWYCHLSSATVSVGKSIKAGDVLGVSGATGTTAVHLHLSVQHIGHGLSGYYLPDVIDPYPYLDQTSTPPSNFMKGVQMRADGNSQASDLQCVTVANLNAVKIMTNTSFTEFSKLRGLVQPENIVLRLFAAGDNPSLGNSVQFVSEQDAWLKEFNKYGGRYVEIHNEPNLPQEGLGRFWSNPQGFANWYSQVASLIKSNYPNLLVGYPGLSPQPNVGEWMATIPTLISQGKVDWVGAHSYWISEADMLSPTGGQHYQGYLIFGRPVIITEFANVSGTDSYITKGEQYKRYYTSLVNKVRGAFSFVTSASDPSFNNTKQTWVVNGKLTDIPYRAA